MYGVLVSQLMQGRLTPNLADEVKKKLEILRDTSTDQESRAAAHAALEEDAELEVSSSISSATWR